MQHGASAYNMEPVHATNLVLKLHFHPVSTSIADACKRKMKLNTTHNRVLDFHSLFQKVLLRTND